MDEKTNDEGIDLENIFLTEEEIAEILNIPVEAVRERAEREKWPYTECPIH